MVKTSVSRIGVPGFSAFLWLLTDVLLMETLGDRGDGSSDGIPVTHIGDLAPGSWLPSPFSPCHRGYLGSESVSGSSLKFKKEKKIDLKLNLNLDWLINLTG